MNAIGLLPKANKIIQISILFDFIKVIFTQTPTDITKRLKFICVYFISESKAIFRFLSERFDNLLKLLVDKLLVDVIGHFAEEWLILLPQVLDLLVYKLFLDAVNFARLLSLAPRHTLLIRILHKPHYGL